MEKIVSSSAEASSKGGTLSVSAAACDSKNGTTTDCKASELLSDHYQRVLQEGVRRGLFQQREAVREFHTYLRGVDDDAHRDAVVKHIANTVFRSRSWKLLVEFLITPETEKVNPLIMKYVMLRVRGERNRASFMWDLFLKLFFLTFNYVDVPATASLLLCILLADTVSCDVKKKWVVEFVDMVGRKMEEIESEHECEGTLEDADTLINNAEICSYALFQKALEILQERESKVERKLDPLGPTVPSTQQSVGHCGAKSLNMSTPKSASPCTGPLQEPCFERHPTGPLSEPGLETGNTESAQSHSPIKATGASRTGKVLEVLAKLQADSHTLAQEAAVILAVLLNDWETASEVLQKSEKIRMDFHSSCAVLKAALSSKMYKTAAYLLHSCLLQCVSFSKAANANRLLAEMERIVRKREIPDIAEKMVETCTGSQLFGLAALIAVWTGDLRKAKRLAVSELHTCKDLTSFSHLILLTGFHGLLLDLISLLPQNRDSQRVVCHMLTNAAFRCRMQTPGARYITKKLISLCTDQRVLVKVLFQAVGACDSDLFCAFVDKDPIDLAQVCNEDGIPVFIKGISYICANFVPGFLFHEGLVDTTEQACGVLLKKYTAVGLTTQPVQIRAGIHDPLWPGSFSTFWFEYPDPDKMGPLEIAVRTRTPELELVQWLYRTGATTYAELYRLKCDSRLENKLESSAGTKSILEYIRRKASNPRSLLDTCVLTVSQHIGCRADRKHRALSLGLPMNLVRRVLFYDILYAGP